MEINMLDNGKTGNSMGKEYILEETRFKNKEYGKMVLELNG